MWCFVGLKRPNKTLHRGFFVTFKKKKKAMHGIKAKRPILSQNDQI